MLCPSPLLLATGESIPLRGLERVPGLPGTRQDEAGLTRTYCSLSPVSLACQAPPVSLQPPVDSKNTQEKEDLEKAEVKES